jgi:NAD(P)-dependent dehydrogenase (short-subunit alcohol dehydrogenase family)
MSTQTFAGKTALITGGNSGIGLATAILLHQHGAKVVIAGRDQKTLDTAAAKIGAGTIAIRADVGKLADIEALFEQVGKQAGKIDVLYANAGIAKFAPITDTAETLYDELFDINVKGVFFTLQKAIPHLNDGASVVLTTSIVNQKGWAGTSVYAATKAALRSFVRTAAAELLPRGIRVNAVSPGPIGTPIFDRMGLPKQDLDAMAQGIVAGVPMKRMGTPDEVAATVAFLAGPGSSYITGVEIEVGGGAGQL